jgi:arginine/lysine/ornithine decarboxylase
MTPKSLPPASPADSNAQTPFADALLRVTSVGMASLHTLPVSGGRSITESALRDKYHALFGEAYLTADTSVSGAVLDSFFRPKSSLSAAQQLAAKAFGADSTLFLTCGTTLANTVAIRAMSAVSAGTGGHPIRVLADRTAHQSIHFFLDQAGIDVTYSGQKHCCDQYCFTWPDIDDLIESFREAAQKGRPFDFVVLSAAGYDGAALDIAAVLTELLRHTDTLNVVVDEAWSAINVFHPRLRESTALVSAQRVRASSPGKRLRMIVTHSAHKSMSALRQGSYLHTSGGPEVAQAASDSLYRHHTTSPSLPILASLDLARAQAEVDGAALVDRSLGLARELRRVVAEDEQLAGFTIAAPPGDGDRWIIPDPTKVLVRADPGLIQAGELRVRLARDYGLYVARVAGQAILVNLHIGVTADVFHKMLTALRQISRSASAMESMLAGQHDKGFLIAYPPGIPLRVPGQELRVDERLLAALSGNGVELFTA